MADALKRSEVESLLTALNPGRGLRSEETDPGKESTSAQPSDRTSQRARRIVSLFEDLRRNSALVTEQCLGEPVRLKRYMPRRIPFSELQKICGDEKVAFLIEAEQTGGDLIVISDQIFLQRFLYHLLGQSTLAPHPGTAFTQTELQILFRWFHQSLWNVLSPSQWRPVAIEQLEDDRQFSMFSPQSAWWCETWELKSDSLRGQILISGQWDYFSSCEEPAEESMPAASSSEGDPNPEKQQTTVVWSRVRPVTSPGNALQLGDLLVPIESDVDERKLSLELSGERIALGVGGELEGRKAVEISDLKAGNAEKSR